MIKLYVIKSLVKNFRYVGITNNIDKRLERHNKGRNLSTRKYRPFELIHTEEFNDYKQARIREIFLKSGKGREFLDNLSDN
jgi:putative endonuclease